MILFFKKGQNSTQFLLGNSKINKQTSKHKLRECGKVTIQREKKDIYVVKYLQKVQGN